MVFEEILSSIQTDFNNIITYSQGYTVDELNSTPILRQWFEAKQSIIFSFGDRLIYEHPEKINFEIDEQEQRKRVRRFRERICDVYKNLQLSNFLYIQEEGFFGNIVVNDYAVNDEITIPKGMKLIKAFKFFESDPETLNQLQSEASQIIQENKVEGTLCLSVHPFDFLSASENLYNWRSCHALDGDYRAGNLSYMCDSTTIVCYLKGKDDVILPDFPPTVPWNNKKWRMLLFAQGENVMFAGRQYPFFCGNALEKIKPIILDALKYAENGRYRYWSHWHNDQLKEFHYQNGFDNLYHNANNSVVKINNWLYILKDIIIDCSDLHYNDLLESSCYTPYYCWCEWDSSKIDPLLIGSDPICPICGKKEISDSSTLCCDDCFYEIDGDDEYGECEWCGRMIYNSEDYGYAVSVYGDDTLLCPYCMQTHTTICEECETVCLENAVSYDKEDHKYKCKNCYEGEKE